MRIGGVGIWIAMVWLFLSVPQAKGELPLDGVVPSLEQEQDTGAIPPPLVPIATGDMPPTGIGDPTALRGTAALENDKPDSTTSQPGDRVKELERRLKDMEEKFKSSEKSKSAKPAPTFPTYKFSGFTQLDSAWYLQEPLNRMTVGDAQDGTEFRRVRFAMLGKVAEKTSYQIEVDFANAGRPSFFDTYVEQQELPFLETLRIGHFLQPFSVDALSGFRNLPFLERSLPFLAFVPFRRVGAMSSVESEDEMTHLAYSVFRTGGFNNAPLGDGRFATDFGDVGGYSFSTRITQLLQYETDACLWHVGMSYDYSQLGANDAVGSGLSGNAGSPKPFYQARVLPEFGPLGYPENSSNFGSAVNGTPVFVDSGRYQADNFQLLGFETVAQDGPWTFQSEWMGTVVQSVAGPVYYQGAYGEVLYRLTGEHRVYDKRLSSLKNPVPFNDFISTKCDGIRGWGAWELAFRWSFVNIRNPDSLDGHYYNPATNNFNTTSKAGNGILNDATVGVSWFINEHTKFQFNWIHSLLDNSVTGRSAADTFAARVQVDFY